MKKLVSIIILCLGCMGVLGAQNIWKPINGTGILGVGPDGNIFAYSEYGELSRSQDEGETWQIVLGQETGFTGHINSSCFAVSHEGRICVFNDNQQTVVYSDDGGDTWQQTTVLSLCGMPTKAGICAPTNDLFVVWAENGEINFTLDGGETWDGWIPDFMNADNGPAISDLLVNENGDVYLGLRTIGGEGGIFRSTLSDMQNWEIASPAGLAIMDMEFDPEGNVVACGWRTEGSIGFQQTPGFYLFDGTSLAIGDGGIVYTPHYSGLQAVLSYSTDHGEHFIEIGEHLPLVDIAPGGENGRLFKGADNHLYFDGGGEYWKCILDADHITNDGNYVPLIHEGNDRQKWNVVYIGANENYPNDYFTEIQSIRDNITLDGVDYKLVWRESVHESKRIAGAVREEDKRVYFRRYWQQSYQNEVLLYDFNLTVGDTVSVGWGDYRLIVLEETQVQVNGTMRRQLGLAMYFDDGTTGEEYWIEGVGSTYGFLNSGYEGWVGAFVHLLCYHENGNLIWDNEAFDDCVMNSDGAPASFAPQGAEWYFNEFDPWSPHPYYSRFYVSGDTVVQGHPCSVINTKFIETGHDGIELVYEENNKVYWFNPTNNNFTILYDFDAEVGDSWYCEVDSCSHLVTVESVENVTWNGRTYRAQWVKSYENDIVVFDGRIIEGIGYEKGLFPFNWACHGDIWFDYGELDYLRCYVVDGEILYHEGNYDCDYVYVNTFCWDGTVAEAYDGGDGTEENPYQIVNAQQLALLAQQTNDGTGGNAYYEMTANVNLKDCLTGGGRPWVSIGTREHPFTGHFNGGGKIIMNLYQNFNDDDTQSLGGLFGYASQATLENVTVSNSTIEGADCAGFVVGWAVNTNIMNCSVGGSISYSYNASCSIGGVAGMVDVDYSTDFFIRNCINNAIIQANIIGPSGNNVYDFGGIVGQTYVDNFWSNGNLYIVGCCNYGDLTGRGDIGGIVGDHEGVVENCDNFGQISSSGTSGGIVGYNEGMVKNCHNHSSGSVTGNCTGGIVGYSLGGWTLSCVNNAPVIGQFKHSSPSASNKAGGIIGYGDHIFNCYNTGDVAFSLGDNMDEDAIYVGGIGGNIDECKNSYNIGAVASSELQYARCGIIAGCFYDTKNVYWHGDYDLPIYGTGNAPEGSCAFRSGATATSWVLDEAQYGTEDLVEALNAGASEIESQYPRIGPMSRWGYDVEGVNDGFPVLVPNDPEDDELEAYCEAPFNFGGSPISDQGSYGTQLWWNKPFASHWFHYDEKPYEGSVYCNNWGIKIPAEEIHAGDVLTHVAFYMAGGQNQTVSYVFAFGFDGETEPDSWDYFPGNSVQIEPGTDGWVMVKLGSPVICEEGKCLWIVLSAPNVEGNNASYCRASGNSNACWSSEGNVAGDWMIRGYFTNDVGYNEAGYNDELDHYNIYRGRTLEELEKIAEVNRDEEEYFDTLQNPFGDYYYQLTAAYTDGRESVPAKRGENPHDTDYVYFHVGNISSLGSEWYYEIENGDGSITYQHLEYDADTTVNDKEVKIIIRTNTLYDKVEHSEVTREYIYEDFGKVYWWNRELQDFTLLYDLGAQIGDEWVIRVGTESLTMHVDTVEQYEYEGTTYRMLRVSDADDLFSGVIMSGIGHLTSFFPERLMTRGKGYRVEGIRCYWREGQLVFKYGDKDCDEVYEQIHFDVEESVETQFKVYPNPTEGVLYVETRHGTSLQTETYRITNLMGQTVLAGFLNAETQQIDVSALPQGMYFITFAGETRKFVVR